MDIVDFLHHENPPIWAGVEPATLGAEGQRQANHATQPVAYLAIYCINYCILTFVNCWDVKWSMTVQNLFTFAKLVALVIIILTGVVQLCYGLAPGDASSSSIRPKSVGGKDG
ncbi:hypothetical protein TNCV_4933321 [Trichonephila clavipes]|nr:hypothetical protein TNCV_4933321 [Trichonephila clavipes]